MKGVMHMRMYDIIHKKRLGGELSREEIEFFVTGYTDGKIPDYQASAFCMAVMFAGMTDRETAELTLAMAHSGDMVDLSRFGERSVDKHSTGGVGDKTTLIVAPTVAALGGKVAKMSGRGLGHTGGTVDKLESIKGYRTDLSSDEFMSQVEKIGVAVIGATGNLAPCDKKLYALRDVTATVESIPLITSSIMSKKIAAGTHSIVLDVTTGSGAFMKTPEEAEILASKMVEIGKRCGRKMSALITNMDTPLGSAIGNALEVKEVIEVLRGKRGGDLREVSEALAAEMVSLSLGFDERESREKVAQAIDSGLSYKKFLEWIQAQGGDPEWIENTELFPKAAVMHTVCAPEDGYISAMNAEKIGIASVMLGAGRENKQDTIDMSAGIVLLRKTGEKVARGEPLAELYTSEESRAVSGENMFLSALEFSEKKPDEKPSVYKIIK